MPHTPPPQITPAWLQDPRAQKLCAVLEAAGHQALFVGGCVRNSLLGAPISDLDLASDALPEQVIALAKAAGLGVIPTGIEHGTVTVVIEGLPIEVTTFRRDVVTDGRHAEVAFSRQIQDDAARRDFTMNALYMDARGQVIDPLGGFADLVARHLRFVGDPEQRIREDYLRILRFFRFHACYGDLEAGLDPEGLAACAALHEGIAQLSAERVGAEMRKLLSAPDPATTVAAMAQSGVLTRVLAGADARALPLLVHFEENQPSSAMARLAALGRVEGTAQRLRLSRREAEHLSLLQREVESTLEAAALAQYHGAQIAREIVLLRASLFEMPPAPDYTARITRGAQAQFPLNAADLMAIGLQGPALGQALKTAKSTWIASDFRLSAAELKASLSR